VRPCARTSAKNGRPGRRLDLGRIDWDEAGALLRIGYRLVAPKKLAAMISWPAAGDGRGFLRWAA
jgi:hypothetical protein